MINQNQEPTTSLGTTADFASVSTPGALALIPGASMFYDTTAHILYIRTITGGWEAVGGSGAAAGQLRFFVDANIVTPSGNEFNALDPAVTAANAAGVPVVVQIFP